MCTFIKKIGIIFIAITLFTASIATSYGGIGQLIEGEQQIGWMAMK